MPFYLQGELEGKELFEGIVAHIYSGEKIMMMVVDVAANGIVPPHSHPHEQAGIVLEGELTFIIDGETELLKEGDVYIIPGDVEHSAVASAEPCKALDIFSPPREEYLD